MRSNVPNDPARRERIISSTIELIVAGGVAAVTARAVAARAGVPLGSVTYYFDSVRALLLETSRRLIERRAERVRDWLAGEDDAACAAVRLAELVHRHLTDERGETIAAYELYLIGLRDEQFREVSEGSIPVLRAALERSLDDDAAARLAAVADGHQLESLFLPKPPSLATTIDILASTVGQQPEARAE